MKIINLLLLAFCFSVCQSSLGQNPGGEFSNDNKFIRLVQGSPGSKYSRLELCSDVDSTWVKWSNRGYSFGFDPHLTPMYTTIDGIISTPYMVQVRGNEVEKNKKRWGYHVFEGFASDDKSRITMLVNKHVELEKPVAELYYYGTGIQPLLQSI